jgi:hypothetical protein
MLPIDTAQREVPANVFCKGAQGVDARPTAPDPNRAEDILGKGNDRRQWRVSLGAAPRPASVPEFVQPCRPAGEHGSLACCQHRPNVVPAQTIPCGGDFDQAFAEQVQSFAGRTHPEAAFAVGRKAKHFGSGR